MPSRIIPTWLQSKHNRKQPQHDDLSHRSDPTSTSHRMARLRASVLNAQDNTAAATAAAAAANSSLKPCSSIPVHIYHSTNHTSTTSPHTSSHNNTSNNNTGTSSHTTARLDIRTDVKDPELSAIEHFRSRENNGRPLTKTRSASDLIRAQARCKEAVICNNHEHQQQQVLGITMDNDDDETAGDVQDEEEDLDFYTRVVLSCSRQELQDTSSTGPIMDDDEEVEEENIQLEEINEEELQKREVENGNEDEENHDSANNSFTGVTVDSLLPVPESETKKNAVKSMVEQTGCCNTQTELCERKQSPSPPVNEPPCISATSAGDEQKQLGCEELNSTNQHPQQHPQALSITSNHSSGGSIGFLHEPHFTSVVGAASSGSESDSLLGSSVAKKTSEATAPCSSCQVLQNRLTTTMQTIEGLSHDFRNVERERDLISRENMVLRHRLEECEINNHAMRQRLASADCYYELQEKEAENDSIASRDQAIIDLSLQLQNAMDQIASLQQQQQQQLQRRPSQWSSSGTPGAACYKSPSTTQYYGSY